MPILMTDLLRCGHCGNRKPRNQFSVATEICLDCFYAAYAFCEDCGTVVRTTRSRGLHELSRPFAEGHRCYQCDYNATRSYPQDCWRPVPFDVSIATYERIGSKVKFGVEVETSVCRDSEDLFGKTPFGRKGDCSISGMEFDSPILYGDEGLAAVEKFLKYGADNSWAADSDCGCHTHYDMRDMNTDQLYSIAYAYRRTISFWRTLVHRSRATATYCHNPRWSCADFKRCKESAQDEPDNFSRLMRYLRNDRYDLINISAYFDHKTFENRMLEGTVDAEMICNWITLNCRFIDGVKDMTIEDIDECFGKGSHDSYRDAAFVEIARIVDDCNLVGWIRSRGQLHREHEFPE